MTEETTPIIIDSQAIAAPLHYRSERGATIEAIIGGWLDAIKTKRSQSEKTQEIYRSTILQFRLLLQSAGLDLLFNTPHFRATIADYAQVFAPMRSPKANRPGSASKATQNQRLAILSSFYHYSVKREHIPPEVGNPIETIDRPSVRAYEQAQAIDKEELQLRLRTLNVETHKGLRDMAILSILLSTGRRVSELTSMRKLNIQQSGKQFIILFDTKGGKKKRDLLEPDVSAYLQSWLTSHYNGQFFRMPDDTPVWVNLTTRKGEALGYAGIAGICETYLGTSKVHTTRHTFTVLMEEAGAKLTDIQKRLGHANPATTGLYLEHLTQDENPYAKKVTELLNLPNSKTSK